MRPPRGDAPSLRGLASGGPVDTPPPPETLHPALWRAHQLGRPGAAVLASGYPELDAQLPGGGWPAGALTELLLPHPGVGELRLLAPVLAALQHQQRCVMCFDPPAAPCAWALRALGIDLQRLVVVQARGAGRHGVPKGRARALLPAADVLWALEQALKSGHVGAVLAWLPARLPVEALRRLQLAAQSHAGPAFLLRDAQMRSQPSAAPLRLLLTSAGPDLLRLTLLKRRGPPPAQPLVLALPAVLSPTALARALQPAGSADRAADLPGAGAAMPAAARRAGVR
ncbi:MAG: translesion DNA synthesis-associated protein ImuA [Rubrivivax sp.]|nr:translesion DNA synthesis-associated protein ImuA [Rubrivivax sp.]